MSDEAISEQFWELILRENPPASNDDIQCLFLAALIEDENFRVQIIERFVKDLKTRRRVLN